MKKLLTTTGLMAAALICQNPDALMDAIGEMGPIITRPNQPSDKSDIDAIYTKYHCRAIPTGAPDGHLPGAPRERDHERL